IWSGDNKNKSSGIQQVQEVVSGRLLYVDVKLNGIAFRIINVYCPPDLQECKEILKEIASILICGQEVIIGGDFNCIIAKEDRKSITTIKLDSSSIDLMNIIKDFKLTDTFRLQNPNIPGFTWSNGFKDQVEFIKILGLSISNNMEKMNWDQRLDKIKWKVKQWEDRDLTLRGKVLVINA
uniref:Endonuclease/exonuclease/phosphatase domain-containing protein n=1 Tax=Sinocyclocheilus grahami TaxID=75366 RepID=A0A672KLJ3_SINGR